MKVFVTGATGFVGSHVAKKLLSENHEVICLVRSEAKAKELLPSSDLLQLVIGDMMSDMNFSDAMKGCDAVIHTAAVTPTAAALTEADAELNLNGTRNIIGSAIASGITNIAYLSSIAAIFNNGHIHLHDERPVPKDLYSKSKQLADNYVRELQAEHPSIHIIYPAGILGKEDPGFSSTHEGIAALVNDACLVTVGGTLMIDVEDLAIFSMGLITNPQSEENRHLAVGNYVQWEEFGEGVISLTNGKAKRVYIPGWMYIGMGIGLDFARKFISINFPVSKESAEFCTKMKPLENSSTFKKLVPATKPFIESLEDTLMHLKSSGVVDY